MLNKIILILVPFFLGLQTEAQKKVFSFEEIINVKIPITLKAATFQGNISVTLQAKGAPTIAIAVSKKGEVLELTKAEFEQHFIYTFKNNGNTLEINVAINENEKKKYWKEEIEVSVGLKLPKETVCDLYTMKGDLEIKGMSGIQKCNTADGNIKVWDVTGGLLLETANGNIILKDIEGSLYANATNGKVQGNMIAAYDSIICNSDYGIINLMMPGTTKAGLFLKGKLVNTSKDNFDGTFERTIVAGKLNGGGIPIRLVAKNGNVALFYTSTK
jgi:hypothetical protein